MPIPPYSSLNDHHEIVYAKWQGRLPASNQKSHAPPYIDRYHVTIPPRTPLAVGQRIKIHALSPAAYHSPSNRPTAYPAVYDTYDPQIRGRIVRIREMTADTVEFVLDNEIPDAAVVLAYVAIHHIPGYTTSTECVERVCKWATNGEPGLTFIPIEHAVIVLDPTKTCHLAGQTQGGTETIPTRARAGDPPGMPGRTSETEETGEAGNCEEDEEEFQTDLSDRWEKWA